MYYVTENSSYFQGAGIFLGSISEMVSSVWIDASLRVLSFFALSTSFQNESFLVLDMKWALKIRHNEFHNMSWLSCDWSTLIYTLNVGILMRSQFNDANL